MLFESLRISPRLKSNEKSYTGEVGVLSPIPKGIDWSGISLSVSRNFRALRILHS